jgi:hypothetical protein
MTQGGPGYRSRSYQNSRIIARKEKVISVPFEDRFSWYPSVAVQNLEKYPEFELCFLSEVMVRTETAWQ